MCLVPQQLNSIDCGVFACQFAYGMIRFINGGKIKRTTTYDSIIMMFDRLAKWKHRKGKKKEPNWKLNEFKFSTVYAHEMRQKIFKLICGLSILSNPESPPATYVGTNNPKNMCFAIAPMQCFLRCTALMKDIAKVENKERDVYSILLFNYLVEIQSAAYRTQLQNISNGSVGNDNNNEENKNNYVYGNFPIQNKAEKDTRMSEFTNGEPHGKFALIF